MNDKDQKSVHANQKHSGQRGTSSSLASHLRITSACMILYSFSTAATSSLFSLRAPRAAQRPPAQPWPPLLSATPARITQALSKAREGPRGEPAGRGRGHLLCFLSAW